MVYFLADLKAYPLRRWPKTGSISDSLLFYEKFPVTQRDFSKKGGRIPALDLVTTIPELVNSALGQNHNTGASKDEPLLVQVLADRKTCMFFESSGQRKAFGNIFKISGAFILRSE
jgi:hypothetical protein